MSIKFDENEGGSQFTQKIDVLEMIINLLREHEEKFGYLVERLEIVTRIIAPNNIDRGVGVLDDIEVEGT